VSNLAWLYVALAATFIAIGGYSLAILARKRDLEERLTRLRGTKH
jgi:CcmD family protein